MDAQFLLKLQRLVDERDMCGCLSRISRGSDRFDRELFLTAFHEDAIIATGPFVGGPVELYEWSAQFQEENYSDNFHKVMNFTCDIEGNTAHMETYYLFVGCRRNGENLLAGGRYVDRFDRRGGEWRIAMRNNFIEWTSLAPAISSPLGDVTDLLLNGLPARDGTDPSYQRPLRNHRKRNDFSRDGTDTLIMSHDRL